MAKTSTAPALVPAPLPVPAQTVLGVPLALTDYSSTLDWIDGSIAARQPGYICVAAVHTVMASQEDAELRSAVLASDLTVPDGQPLVWAMNLLGHSLPSRVYGPDLFMYACQRAARTGARFYLYGGRETSLERLRTELPRRYPGLQLVGVELAPFRELSDDEAAETAARINAVRRGRRLGRARRAAAGEVDGRGCASGSRRRCWSASAPPSTSTRGSRSRRPTASSASGSSGRSACRRSRGGCGGATCTTTRASSPASPASTAGTCGGAARCESGWSFVLACAAAALAAAPARADLVDDDPAVAAQGTGDMRVFIRGHDNALWTRSWNGSSWSGWSSLGGVLTSGPAAMARPGGIYDVFVRGTDNAI